MKNIVGVLTVMAIVGVPAMNGRTAASQATSSVRVHVVITNTSVQEDQAPPSLQVRELTVKQGKTPPEVNQLIPARGKNRALQWGSPDDLDRQAGGAIDRKLPELIKQFIAAQPPSTCGRDWLYLDNDRRRYSELHC